ncbi:hypothetical protein B566_EDAN006473 [Ephemera danica]|nr:hypothetical protein B566_EDAN006473 [Ephemera danica]
MLRHAPNWDTSARLLALLAQAEQADDDLPVSLVPLCAGAPSDLMHRVATERLGIRDMKPSTAEYWLLKEVSNLDTFGDEQFNTRFPDSTAVIVGVGPHGVSLYDPDATLRQSIPYTAIQRASSQRRTLHLVHLEGAGASEAQLELKLDSSHSAASLYRCITEKHAFYSCETVRSAVTSQFIRDLKGTIVSIFNEDTSLGKKYVFDIRRTCREVYDNARRALYQSGEVLPRPMDTEEQSSSMQSIECASPGQCPPGVCKSETCKASRDQLAGLLDAISCCICMDNDINTAFFPCGHVISCHRCAARCERCPLCRANIGQAKPVYLPAQLRAHSHIRC